jgi:hypothetical protein
VINDLLSGQVQITFTVPGSGMPHVKSGRLRALAVSTAKRSAVVPDLPTIAESGVPRAAIWRAARRRPWRHLYKLKLLKWSRLVKFSDAKIELHQLH